MSFHRISLFYSDLLFILETLDKQLDLAARCNPAPSGAKLGELCNRSDSVVRRSASLPRGESPSFKKEFFKEETWQALKVFLIRMYLLKRARKWAKSSFLRKRHFALRCFALAPQRQDEGIIIHLMDDPIFSVYSRAAFLAIALESVEGGVKILHKMARARGYIRSFYQELLLKGSKEMLASVMTVSRQVDPTLHLTCLEVLSELRTSQQIDPLTGG